MLIKSYSKFTLLLTCSSFAILFCFYKAQASTYTYDELNRLASVQHPNGHLIEYDYNSNGNMTMIRYITPTDSDGDGLPDSWEQPIIDADTEDSINSVVDVLSTVDFDGDGLSNGREYKYDTDPTDSLSPSSADLNIDKEITIMDAVIALQILTGKVHEAAIGSDIPGLARDMRMQEALKVLQIVCEARNDS